MLMKRATKKVRKQGIVDLEVHKSYTGFGFVLFDPALRYVGQTSRVYRTPEEAIEDAVAGYRPMSLAKMKGVQVEKQIPR